MQTEQDDQGEKKKILSATGVASGIEWDENTVLTF